MPKNGMNDDGCTNACELPRCGDKIVQRESNNESCDCGDYNASQADNNGGTNCACALDCTFKTCSTERDGTAGAGTSGVEPGAQEECDDGESTNDADCLTMCVDAMCGDGYINDDEECDPATMLPGEHVMAAASGASFLIDQNDTGVLRSRSRTMRTTRTPATVTPSWRCTTVLPVPGNGGNNRAVIVDTRTWLPGSVHVLRRERRHLRRGDEWRTYSWHDFVQSGLHHRQERVHQRVAHWA